MAAWVSYFLFFLSSCVCGDVVLYVEPWYCEQALFPLLPIEGDWKSGGRGGGTSFFGLNASSHSCAETLGIHTSGTVVVSDCIVTAILPYTSMLQPVETEKDRFPFVKSYPHKKIHARMKVLKKTKTGHLKCPLTRLCRSKPNLSTEWCNLRKQLDATKCLLDHHACHKEERKNVKQNAKLAKLSVQLAIFKLPFQRWPKEPKQLATFVQSQS